MRISDAADCRELLASIRQREENRGLGDSLIDGHANYDMLPIWGDSPWGGENHPAGIHSWHIGKNQVMVGEEISQWKIITYEEALEIWKK